MIAAPGRARRLTRWAARRAPDIAPAALGVAALAGGLAAAVRPALAVAVAALVTVVRPTLLAVRAIVGLPSGPRTTTLRWALGLLVVGSTVAAVAAVGAGLADLLAPDVRVMEVPLPAEIPNVALFFSAGPYLIGLLLLPGTAPTLTGRIRRVLDGASVGICAFFIAWVLVFSTLGLKGAALTVTLLGSIAIGGAAVAGIRAARYDWRRLAAAGGVIVSIIGQACLTIALDFPVAGLCVVCAGALVAAAPLLMWPGLRAVAGDPHRPVPVDPDGDGDGSFAGYPVLAIPLGGAILAAGYHFVQQRSFDGTSIVLCIAGVTLVAIREAMAALDVRRYAARLAAQRAHFRSLFAGSTDVTLVLDGDLMVRWQSPAAARLLGLSDQDVVGKPLLALLHPDDVDLVAEQVVGVAMAAGADETAAAEARFRDGFDGWRDVELRMSDQRDMPAVAALVAHIRDVSDRKVLERTLYRAAFADQLTTLPNRRELRRAVADRAEAGVVMVICLDGVAGVNDMHGRAVGDAVLVEAARRLRTGLSAEDLAARLDGDKFAVVTAAGAIQAQLLATRLLTALTEPYPTPATTAYVSARVGLAELATGPHASEQADEVLRRAELALRRAKRRGRGGAVEWHDESMEAVVRRQLAIEQQLPGAIERGELELRFQPVVELTKQRPVGAEAVLSWRRADIGTVTADELLPVADELGLGLEITEWALHRVCRQLSSWRRDGHDLWISLDVMADQVAGAEFTGVLTAALQTHQVPAANLVVEIAEAGLNPAVPGGRGRHNGGTDPAADDRAQSIIEGLAELRTLGIRVAVDHFGTATTSLSQLRLLPVDLLKVDRALFSEAGSGPTTAIIDVMVRFGHQLGVEVAAQGLLDEADLETARAAGCRYGQGELLSAPVPAEYLEAYLDSHRLQRF